MNKMCLYCATTFTLGKIGTGRKRYCSIYCQTKKYSEDNRDYLNKRKRILWIDIKDKINERIRTRYAENDQHREEVKNKKRIYYANNREKAKLYAKHTRSNNKNYKQQNKKRAKRCRDELDDSYIKSLIVEDTTLCAADIPHGVVLLKRQQLIVKRELRSKL